jgi:glycosyltransferase involved in cell wall biosynthesis
MPGSTLLFIVNVDWFFISHRLAIGRAARDAGYDVHIACKVTGREAELEAEGFTVHPLRLHRTSTGGSEQLRVAREMAAVIRKVRPHIAHLVTIKPVLIGGAVARRLKVPKVVAAISGLGFIFIAKGLLARARRQAIGALYRYALSRRNVRVIFQNEDDRKLVTRLAGISPGQIRMIRGSGVDLDRLKPEPLPDGPFCAVFAARLLVDKGVREFVEAARALRARGVEARFIVAGDLDPDNPACVPAEEVEAWRKEGLVELPGHVAEIGSLFAAAHAVVLPSYREGMPLSLLEAAACGRAVITTDVPGCRDAIEPGVTGILVPPRESAPLADATAALAADRSRCAELGRQGRLLAERAFSIEEVVRRHLEIYAEPVP